MNNTVFDLFHPYTKIYFINSILQKIGIDLTWQLTVYFVTFP